MSEVAVLTRARARFEEARIKGGFLVVSQMNRRVLTPEKFNFGLIVLVANSLGAALGLRWTPFSAQAEEVD